MSTSNPPHQSDWTTRQERSNVYTIRFMAWLSLTLGRPLSRVVLHGITLYFLLFAPRARHALQDYYQHLWQRRATWKELYRHFLSFASVVHDRIFFLSDKASAFNITSAPLTEIEATLGQNQGVLMMGAHFGSFEVLRYMGTQKYPTYMLMYTDNAAQFNQVAAALNPDLLQHIISLNRIDSMMIAQQRLAEGAVLGALADRDFTPGQEQLLPFLGQTAAFPKGAWRMAAMFRCPVFFLAGIYLGGNQYHIHIKQLADFSQCPRSERSSAIATAQQAYVHELEQLCQQYPTNWFNFYPFWHNQPSSQ